jgi:monofunctional biosynthetic peptidoglycan transglycosylase
MTRRLRIDPDPDGERRAAARARLARRSRPRRWLRRGLALIGLLAILSIVPVALLRAFNPPLTALMLGEWLQAHMAGERGFSLRHDWLDAARIAPPAARAVIAAEDQRFYTHHGFDIDAIRAALADRAGGARLRGASTISQQVAKNLFLWRGRHWLRKGLEAWFTVWLELLCPKRRILEVYLNVAQFGPGLYGVEAASREFFGHGAESLDARESALLAAVLPNPRAYSAREPGPYLRQRQAWILGQMQRLPPLPGSG